MPVPLQLSDSSLGGHAGLPLCVGTGPFLREGRDVLPRLRAVPAQLAVGPPDEEVEYAAVPLQHPFLDSLNGDGFVSPNLDHYRAVGRCVPAMFSPAWWRSEE